MAQHSATDDLTVSLPNDLEYVITRDFDAPRELVFEAMTRPEHTSSGTDRVAAARLFATSTSGSAAATASSTVPPTAPTIRSRASTARSTLLSGWSTPGSTTWRPSMRPPP